MRAVCPGIGINGPSPLLQAAEPHQRMAYTSWLSSDCAPPHMKYPPERAFARRTSLQYVLVNKAGSLQVNFVFCWCSPLTVRPA